jgi:hypothetical protein
MGYPIGRIVIENMRSDEANHILGQRVNTWVSILVFLLGLFLWFRFARMPQPDAPRPDDAPASEGDAGPEAPGDASDDDASEDPAVGGLGDEANDAPASPAEKERASGS